MILIFVYSSFNLRLISFWLSLVRIEASHDIIKILHHMCKTSIILSLAQSWETYIKIEFFSFKYFSFLTFIY